MSFWRTGTQPVDSMDASFIRVFTGNAFEAPSRTGHQRPRPRRLLRTLLAWLPQPLHPHLKPSSKGMRP
jgi:hypothetical protein